MENNAENRGISSNGKPSILDWPTPEMIASAHRARAKALREMTWAFGRRLWSFIAVSSLLSNGARRHGRERHGPVQR
jgi:hypothetical protein